MIVSILLSLPVVYGSANNKWVNIAEFILRKKPEKENPPDKNHRKDKHSI